MYHKLQQDREQLPQLLEEVLKQAQEYLTRRDDTFVAPTLTEKKLSHLPQEGIGAQKALEEFKARYSEAMLATSGPRFFGFVIGGNTPAALMGDWLTSLYDQDAFGIDGNADRQIELEAIAFLRELFDLPEDYTGVFVSGATMANCSALAIAREWAAQSQGKTANDGIYGLTPPTLLTGVAHASVYKGLSLLGIGRNGVVKLPCLPGREAVDVAALESYLAAHPTEKIIVIANLGTVNSGDLDDLQAIAALKDKYDFYLHVEGAIGAVAMASPLYRPLFNGVEKADSITIDAHKWLNTPYDCAVLLVRGKALQELQYRVFAQAETVTDPMPEASPFFNLTPEGSRRMRSLPAWFTLKAYGKEGYRELVERNCAMARRLAQQLSAAEEIQLMHEVRLNVLSFTLNLPSEKLTVENINAFADLLRKQGITYMNTASLFGKPVVRSAISNWSTQEREIDQAAQSIVACAREFCAALK